GRVAPLDAYLALVRRRGGLLLVDDTQALGVLGARRGTHPYGTGGGGSPAWTGARGPGLVVVASLAKGFGVPVAVVSGERSAIGRPWRSGPRRWRWWHDCRLPLPCGYRRRTHRTMGHPRGSRPVPAARDRGGNQQDGAVRRLPHRLRRREPGGR